MSKYWKANNEYNDNLLKEIVDIIPPNTFYRLNQQKSADTSFLEKIVYNIITFHSNRLSINSKYIEFGFIDKKNDFMKNEGVTSNLSIIVFFDNNNNPFLITNLIEETYKYKKFDDLIISCSLPKKLNHIIFEPNKYYHSIFNKKTLVINILDEYRSNSIPFPKKIFSLKHYFHCNNMSFDFIENEFKSIFYKESKSGFNYDYFDELIYIDSSKYENLINLINTEDRENFDVFEFKLDKFEMNHNNRIDISKPKFIQRFIKKNLYQPYICHWIINESEKYAFENGGWTTTRHNEYPTTDLPVNKITSIFPFISESLQNSIQFIKKSYCLDDKHIFNVNDVFIVKYDANRQSHLKIHTDYSEITVNILLSDPSDFQGGGTYFDDGIVTYLEKGDALIHSGRTKHAGLEITKGKRYILVAFIHIHERD